MKIGICSCNKGKFGQFCIHQCAIYLHFDTFSQNFPPVTSDDRHNIALLADGDEALPLEFCQPFILDNNFSITENINNEEVVQSNHDILNNTNLTNQNNTVTTSTNNGQEMPQMSINNVINLFKKIHQQYGSSSSGLNTIETRLKKIKSKGNWESFLHTAGNQAVQLRRRSGAAIHVQSTTIARRLPAVTRGSKRLPSGRPAKNEIILNKRRRNLEENIKLNQPNAKSHGSGH